MKPFIFFGLYAFISFCSFSSQGKEVEVSSKGLAYYFLQQESVFNNKDIKNEFLAQFFSEKERARFENTHICALQKKVLEKNKSFLNTDKENLQRYLTEGCMKRGHGAKDIVHPRWKKFLYTSFDNKRICDKKNECGDILEEGENQIVVGWDKYGVEIFTKNNDDNLYKYSGNEYDLSKKYPNLNKDSLSGFVEIKFPTGGIGNSLFVYWSGVVYALKNNKKPLFYGRSYLEDYLTLPFKTTEKVEFNYEKKPVYIQKYVNTFVSNGSSHHEIDPQGNFIYLNGYSQSWRNFVGYEDYIREHTVFKHPMLEKNKEISLKMQKENSVSVHVRRGDYVTHGYILLTQNYYNQAISYMKANLDNPHFYIFSNDIKWASENLKIDAPHTFVGWNKKDYEDLQLMSYCKHHIIANSTFSWWGAFLSKNKNKIVISPNKHASWNIDWISSLLSPDFVVFDVETYYYDYNKKKYISK